MIDLTIVKSGVGFPLRSEIKDILPHTIAARCIRFATNKSKAHLLVSTPRTSEIWVVISRVSPFCSSKLLASALKRYTMVAGLRNSSCPDE